MNSRTTLIIKLKNITSTQLKEEVDPLFLSTLLTFGEINALPVGSDLEVVMELFEVSRYQEIIRFLKDSAISSRIENFNLHSTPEKVVQILKNKKMTLAVSESCTGGLLSSLITDISGSSEIFLGSVVSYANSAKTTLLGVKPETLKAHGAVSTQVAIEMAEGTLQAFESDYALATTGIAGPLGGSKEKPVGTIAIALASKEGAASALYHFNGSRLLLKDTFARAALHQLLMKIE